MRRDLVDLRRQRQVGEKQDAVDGLVLQRDVDFAGIESDGGRADGAKLDALPAAGRPHLFALPVIGSLDVSVAAVRHQPGRREAEQELQAALLFRLNRAKDTKPEELAKVFEKMGEVAANVLGPVHTN